MRPLPWLKEETAFAHSLPWTLEARTLLSSSQVYPRATKHNQDLNPSRSPSCSSTLLPLFLSHSSTIYSSRLVCPFVAARSAQSRARNARPRNSSCGRRGSPTEGMLHIYRAPSETSFIVSPVQKSHPSSPHRCLSRCL